MPEPTDKERTCGNCGNHSRDPRGRPLGECHAPLPMCAYGSDEGSFGYEAVRASDDATDCDCWVLASPA